MYLGSNQPLTEMSTRSISWGQRRPVPKVDNLYHHPVPLSRNLGTLTSWNPLGHTRPVTRLLYRLGSIHFRVRCAVKDVPHVLRTYFLVKLPYVCCCADVECVFRQTDRTHLIISLMAV